MSRRATPVSPRTTLFARLARLAQGAAVSTVGATAAAAAVLVVGCASSDTHPPMAGGCEPDAPCTLQPPPVGSGPETGTSDTGAGDGNANDGGLEIAVSGEIRRPTAYSVAPSKGTVATTNVDIQALRADGSTIVATPLAGVFTLPTVGRATDGAWLRLRSSSVVKTLMWVDTSGGDVLGAEVPLFDDALPQVTSTTVGLPVAVAGTATVVLHVLDATGAPIAGVSTSRANYLDSTIGYFGPYFDDGFDGITHGASTTGGKGTLVYLAVDPTITALGFNVPLVVPSLGTRSVSFPVKADAVSYREFVAK